MSKTKDVIMDIMDWYGYIPKNYTFEDYHRDVKKRKEQNKEPDRSREETDSVHDENQETRIS